MKKIKGKILASLLSISMLSAFAPVASAEETPTSGTFGDGDVFKWEYSDYTLTFSLNEGAEEESYCLDAKEYVDVDKDTIFAPWDIYLKDVKHIVFGDRIERVDYYIFLNLDILTSPLETITCSEYMRDTDPLQISRHMYKYKNITFIAPRNSYVEDDAYLDGINFVSDGTIAKITPSKKSEDGYWEYRDDISTMKVNSTDAPRHIPSRWYGRYQNILISRDAAATKDPLWFKQVFIYCRTKPARANKSVVVYCFDNYPYIDELRAEDEDYSWKAKVVVLGESNSELKGDATLDGNIDISDATAVLDYYSNKTAGIEASFKNDEELNKFAYYLADTDTESTQGADSDAGNISISDATNILKYCSQSIAGLAPDWQEIIAEN